MNMVNFEKYMLACSQGQSNYAVEHFIDGAQLTPARRFRQAVIELDTASVGYEETKFNLAKQQLKLTKKELKLEKMKEDKKNYLDIQIVELEIERTKRRIARTERSMEGKRREMRQHVRNLEKSEKEMGFTDQTTEEEVYQTIQQAEADYYLTKFATDTAAHVISRNGGPSVGILLALQQLPKEDIERFQVMFQGAVQSMSQDRYIPALHDHTGAEGLMEAGHKALAAMRNKEKQLTNEN